jgi:hypothetical protein
MRDIDIEFGVLTGKDRDRKIVANWRGAAPGMVGD